MKPSTLLVFCAAHITIGSLISQATAAVIVVAPTASAAGSFQITNDITFTITTSVNSRVVIVLDDWVASDGSRTITSYSPFIYITINGGIPATYSGSFIDNYTFNVNQLTPKDGYFVTDNSLALVVGDTLTLKAGQYSIGAVSGFNPQATQTFTGSMFVTDVSANQISNSVLVPEPATSGLLLGGGVLALALVRSRKK